MTFGFVESGKSVSRDTLSEGRVSAGRPSGPAFLGHFPRLTLFLDEPEVRVLRNHRFVLACDVARHDRKTIRSQADLLPFRSRKADASHSTCQHSHRKPAAKWPPFIHSAFHS